MSFKDVKVGETVTRILCGDLSMLLKVTKVDESLIHCGGWTFDRETGVEVDELLGWGSGMTGSYLVKKD